MKHSGDDGIFQTNLLQALQKNKVIQGKLIECQHTYYVQLLKEMENHNLKEKYNRELLYKWKKESYIRQLRKNLQEYEQKSFGYRNDYYESQLKSLENILTGQQNVVIPPSEEERRSNIHAKYQQFLDKNPLQSSSLRVVKSANIPVGQTTQEQDDEENTHGVEATWKHIHAQSAVGSRRKKHYLLPTLQRSTTMDEIRRRKTLNKTSVPSSAVAASKLVPSSSEEKIQRSPRSPTKSALNQFDLPEGVEPLVFSSEPIDKHNRVDLVSMRSVRRARKNPSELNLIFETRKRMYEINRQAFSHHLCQRNFGFQQSMQFDRQKPIDSIEDNKHPTEKVTI